RGEGGVGGAGGGRADGEEGDVQAGGGGGTVGLGRRQVRGAGASGQAGDGRCEGHSRPSCRGFRVGRGWSVCCFDSPAGRVGDSAARACSSACVPVPDGPAGAGGAAGAFSDAWAAASLSAVLRAAASSFGSSAPGSRAGGAGTVHIHSRSLSRSWVRSDLGRVGDSAARACSSACVPVPDGPAGAGGAAGAFSDAWAAASLSAVLRAAASSFGSSAPGSRAGGAGTVHIHSRSLSRSWVR